MAKKKRTQAKRPSPARKPDVPEARVVHDKPLPSEEPRFWFGFEVTWAKLLVTRVVLFGLLALDAVLQLRHAPRYGANDFNVANLSFLDSHGPGRVGYGVSQLVISLLLTAAAFGVATRIVLPIATVLYAWLYFGSQLDSYQHHYLVALILAIACFVPWQRKPDTAPATPVRSWALRLLLVQMGIMYLWAAISKLDPVWLDGTALGTQITGSMKSLIDGTIGFMTTAVLVVVVEFALAFTVWLKPAWKVAAPLGIAFHLGIVATGFEIGLFAYVMCALYILVVPDRIWRSASEIGFFDRTGRLARMAARGGGQVAMGLAVLVGLPLAILCRLPHAFTLALIALGVALAVIVAKQIRKQQLPAVAPAAVLAALMLWTVVDRSTSVAIDYYRFWGGSQRRVGDRAQAEQAYRGMLEVEPSNEIAHYYLGRILLMNGNDTEGLEHLHAAQESEPGRVRSYLEEAGWLANHGKHDEAIHKALDAVQRAEDDQNRNEAKAVLKTLQDNKPLRPTKIISGPDEP